MKKFKQSLGFSKIIIIVVVAILVVGSGFYFYKSSDTKVIATPQKTTYKIAGSGSASFALKMFTEKFTNNNPLVSFEFEPSSDASIAFLGIKEKTIDIGASSRLPKPAEEDPSAEIIPFAKDAIVLAVNNSVAGVTELKKEEIAGIWSGKITNWSKVGGPNANIVVIDREEDESSKKQLRSIYIGNTKITDSATEVHSESEMLHAIESTQNSIGMLSYARVKNNPKVITLKLDGVGVEDVDSGKYPYVRMFYVVINKEKVTDLTNFMEYLKNSKLHNSFGLFEVRGVAQ